MTELKILFFRIQGLDCAEEVAVLKREVGPLTGGEERLSFDILKGRMGVSVRDNHPSDEDVMKAVARTGMKAEIWQEDKFATQASSQRKMRSVLTFVSGLSLIAGFLSHAWISGSFMAAIGSEGLGIAHSVPLFSKILYFAAIIAGIWYVAPKSWFALKSLRPDMNLLMTIAILGAILIGEWFEAATVSFLFALSLAMEAWSVGRARKAVEALLDLTPPTVTILSEDGGKKEVPLSDVKVGSVFMVKPGARMPLDGTVTEGESEVNQAPITGESIPVFKTSGSEIFAGSINGNGALEIQSTKDPGETTLAHIVKMVDHAQSSRAPAEQWVEKFARYYTPAILILAVLVLLVPPLLLERPWSDWVYRSLVLLVIACPCALVISTPVSIVAALTAAARQGVLIKGGTYVELPSKLKAVAMDKTGTLTEGKPSVDEVLPMSGHSAKELIEIVAAMESRSDHPLAKAILNYASDQKIIPALAEDFQIIPGKGATGKIDGKEYWVGSHRYLEERGQETGPVHDKLEVLSQTGRTVVLVGDEKHVCGLITVVDNIRPESKSVVSSLRDAGIQHVIMLTGDNKGTAEAIARKTGVDEIQSELLPQDKVSAVESLVNKYHNVAMVGDGVNDAPAMARATLGIAMGAIGSDVAIETADIALMSDDLSKIPWLIFHSKRTVRIIRQNIAFSLLVKGVFVTLTFAGYASLWAAIAADMGASLIVIFNGLRLLKTESITLR